MAVHEHSSELGNVTMPLRAPLLFCALIAVAELAAPPVVQAQQYSVSYTAIDGTVVDTAGRGMNDVDVVVMGTDQLVHTNHTGAYRIDSVAPGPHLLRFRRLGLQPQTIPVVTVANDVTGVDVIMGPLVHQLDVVEVQASNGEISRVPKMFADRMRTGQGVYITPAQIANHHAVATADLFRGVPGIEVDEYDSVVRSARGNVTIQGSVCSTLPVYINDSYAGSRSPASLGTEASTSEAEKSSTGSSRSGLSLNLRGVTNLEMVNPNDIVGIEIYRGPSEMPGTLPPSPCGAIVIWTK